MRTLIEQADAIARGEISPAELVERSLHAVETVEHATNAFTVVLPDDAMDAAKRLGDRHPEGPLHGVPVAVKDLYDIAGVRTTGCCAAYDRVPDRDSAVVERLRTAGAVIVAKTNQHELALGTSSQLSSFGPVRNPFDAGRSPGGSSGGSAAAVAAGAVAMAMGSDTGGSIRIPASFCGITGLKPTHGATSLRGVMPLAPSLDTVGPLAHTAADCALIHRIVSAYDPDDLRSIRIDRLAAPTSVAGLRIGVATSWLDRSAGEVAAAVRVASEVLADLGATVVEADVDVAGARDRIGPLLLAEAAHHFAHLIDDGRVSDDIRQGLALGAAFSGRDYARAREAALEVRRAFDLVFEDVHAVLGPSTAYVAPPLDSDTVPAGGGSLTTDAVGTTVFTIGVNGAGLPSLAFPVGAASDGLPIGAQLVGPTASELRLCAIGAAFQQATEHHLAEPTISP